MATEKGKTLKVDVEKKTVLVKTVISDKDWDKQYGKDRTAVCFVQFDFSTMGMEEILKCAANDLRIAVRRAHLVPMGPDECEKTSEEKPFVVSAENAGTSGRPRSQRLEDKTEEQLLALIAKAQELLKAKKAS